MIKREGRQPSRFLFEVGRESRSAGNSSATTLCVIRGKPVEWLTGHSRALVPSSHLEGRKVVPDRLFPQAWYSL